MPFIDTLRGFDADFRESSEFRIVIVGLFPASDGEKVASHRTEAVVPLGFLLERFLVLSDRFEWVVRYVRSRWW